MSELQPHQQRVVDEKNELGARLQKLQVFVGSKKFNEVAEPERSLPANDPDQRRACASAASTSSADGAEAKGL